MAYSIVEQTNGQKFIRGDFETKAAAEAARAEMIQQADPADRPGLEDTLHIRPD
jgi:hypothetical protein